ECAQSIFTSCDQHEPRIGLLRKAPSSCFTDSARSAGDEGDHRRPSYGSLVGCENRRRDRGGGMSGDEARRRARRLERAASDRGAPLEWFEDLYSSAHGPGDVSWADLEPNPSLTEWLEREHAPDSGGRALVVGCGLGDDAEALAALRFEVVAFDIAPTAIEWARRRFRSSPVEYLVANALDPPDDWQRRFDFVL